jgi:membrane protein implicated in regulation of membrane protease activity
MSKIVIVTLVLALLLLGFSAALFMFELPIWLPIVLVVLSVVTVALMASKVAKKMRKARKHHDHHESSVPQTPRCRRVDSDSRQAPRRPPRSV